MSVTLQFRSLALRLAAAFAALLCGCQSPLITAAANAVGRRLPTLAMTESDEIRLGEQSYRDILSHESRTIHPEYQQVVERIGRRIADVSGRTDYQWEFTTLAGPTQNAFCLPGGKVAVYEGLFPLCENEAGLAVVMSHEIAHALARHGGERMRNQALVDAVGDVVSSTTDEEDSERKLMVQGMYGAASQLGVILPFSRQHESEADSIGLMLMARAGYDPAEASRFWKRFSSADQSRTPELFSTHPTDEHRAADLERLEPQALALYRAAPSKLGRGPSLPQLAISQAPPAAAGNSTTVGPAPAPPSVRTALVTTARAVAAPPPAASSQSDDPWLNSGTPETAPAAFEIPTPAPPDPATARHPADAASHSDDAKWVPARHAPINAFRSP